MPLETLRPIHQTSSTRGNSRIAQLPASSTLKSIHTTLHLLHHRNKNQHGSTKWWKWLAMLKRSIAQLMRDVERWEWKQEHSADDEDDGGDSSFQTQILKRMCYLHIFVVPRCYVAFSTVLVDMQFSALGVVLLAVLAQAAKAVAHIEEFHLLSLESNTSTDNNSMSAIATTATAVPAISINCSENVGVDVGEVVNRLLHVPELTADPAAFGEKGKQRKKENDSGQKEKNERKRSPFVSDAIRERQKLGVTEKSRQESPLTQLDEDEREKEAARQKRKKIKIKQKKRNRDAIDDIFGKL
ncbi:conserved hypothetical protein [Histoplasma capsulatum var. duboisii H88]|uniref:Nitrositive-stress induced transcript n=2 Tax=Ajellomyces capsulatus TaxID=5037 RepID=F0UFV1_AJEC8|nr:conserved hypothetical protein [Histoplasma capsulatum H143]EGC44208.1 conserved hypothetical protein [Histoplasma capsulatum var. duboisii H88]QSS54987.1 nitrositive-stress induced transcript [Histoplasma capsulatum var. duboisii H88]